MPTDTTPRQGHLEQLARDTGAKRVRDQIREAIDAGRGAETPANVLLMKRALEPLANAIRAAIEEANTGKVGRRMIATRLLDGVEPELAAYCALRGVLNSVARSTGHPSVTTIASQIGRDIEMELRLSVFEGTEPNLYNKIDRQLKERGSGPAHMGRVFLFAANKSGVKLPSFSHADKLHLGMKLIDILVEITGFVEVVHVTDRGKTRVVLQPNEKIIDWSTRHNTVAELLHPIYLPTVVPPRDWSSPVGGGYYTSALRALPLVKRCSAAQRELLNSASMSTVFVGLNHIQRTGWRINKPVLEVMSHVWDKGLEIAMPYQHARDVPAPTEADLLPAEDGRERRRATKSYRQMARAIHEANAASLGRRLNITQIIKTAKALADEPVVFFPHQLDFRGRAYAVPVGLNPQGSDYSKALLTFAEGKPINDPRAAGWLAIHGANLFGYDKANLADRIKWVEDNEQDIKLCATDPLQCRWWTEADKPWCFLAWCFEYAAFLAQGYGYVSSLPISVDGSCNGLQHFSAMLRDPIGGAAVNLVPSPTPADIYQRVADRVIEKLRAITSDVTTTRDSEGFQQMLFADGWKQLGCIDRKVTKRPVMVLPYGGTFRSCLKYVCEAVAKKIDDGTIQNPFGDELYKAETFLAKLVWESIGDVVVAARTAMAWLQKCARETSKLGQPISWVAPSGFPAFQAYRDERARRVKTKLQGSLVYLSLIEDTDKLNVDRQAQGISPNFVHSMDAAAMMLTIELASHNGVSQFAMIHDSYGTVAADMDMLSECLRIAFVDMYKDHHVLAEFLAGLPEQARQACPAVPEMGTLVLDQVLQSEFFFA